MLSNSVIFIRSNVKEEKMFNNVFQYSFLFYFHFHTEHCMHDEGLLLVYVCVYIGICVCIYMDLFLRQKCVTGHLDSAWSWTVSSPLRFVCLFLMLQTGILRKYIGSRRLVLNAFPCSKACYCLTEYLLSQRKCLSRWPKGWHFSHV